VRAGLVGSSERAGCGLRSPRCGGHSLCHGLGTAAVARSETPIHDRGPLGQDGSGPGHGRPAQWVEQRRRRLRRGRCLEQPLNVGQRYATTARKEGAFRPGGRRRVVRGKNGGGGRGGHSGDRLRWRCDDVARVIVTNDGSVKRARPVVTRPAEMTVSCQSAGTVWERLLLAWACRDLPDRDRTPPGSRAGIPGRVSISGWSHGCVILSLRPIGHGSCAEESIWLECRPARGRWPSA